MRKLIAAAFLLVLAACQTTPPATPQKPHFSGPVYRFNVADVQVVDDYAKDRRPARTEYEYDYSLGEAMHDWTERRIAPVGTANRMEVVIRKANLNKKDLPKQKTGIEGMLTKEQTEEYSGELEVELKIYSPERRLPVSYVTVTSSMSRTLREDATLHDRKVMYAALLADIMKDIDKSLDKNIRSYMNKHLAM